MRRTSILALLLLIVVSFGIAGGCNSNNNGNNGDGEVPDADPEFNLELAIELAELALVAYEQRIQCIKGGEGAITVPSEYKLEEVIFEAVSSLLDSTCEGEDDVVPIAFIATKDDNIYLSFRGTANIMDDVDDAAALQEPYKFVPMGGSVSLGFQGVYEGDEANPVESAILSKLDELTMTGNFNNLFITGHSLGAALAFLAFPDLSQNLGMIDSVTMYNFAGPAVGDSQFVSTYEGEESLNRISFRIVNEYDLVPKLPPLGLDCPDFDYHHVDGKHEIMFGEELPALPDFAAADCDLITIAGDILNYGIANFDGILENHSMCTYFDALCAMGSSPGTCSQRAIGCNDGNTNP